jgi:hypothetical protein
VGYELRSRLRLGVSIRIIQVEQEHPLIVQASLSSPK